MLILSLTTFPPPPSTRRVCRFTCSVPLTSRLPMESNRNLALYYTVHSITLR